MTHPILLMLSQANLQRTKYLLRNYPRYLAQCPKGLDISISKAIMDILSFSLGSREHYAKADCDLMDRCGSFLAPAIQETANEIKSFPIDISSKIYPVLYHQYFSPEGTAIDIDQLSRRLTGEDIDLPAGEICSYLSDGERMMSALLFPTHLLSAMRACD